MGKELSTIDFSQYANRKTLVQKHLSKGGTLSNRHWNIDVDMVAGSAAAAVMGGFILSMFAWIFSGNTVSSFETAAIVAGAVGPAAVVLTSWLGYLFGPLVYQQLAVAPHTRDITEMPLLPKAHLLAKVRRADRRQGWRPRAGITHPRGRDDVHDRFVVRFVAGEDTRYRLSVEHWQCNAQRVWALASTDSQVSFDENQEDKALEHYNELCRQASHRQDQAKDQLVDDSSRLARQQQMKALAAGLDGHVS